MSENVSHFEAWIKDGGPSALILKEYLEPASGAGAVIFPPTFAPPEERKGTPAGYIIDGEGDKAVCLIDSVGSQANRLEPEFKKGKYRRLVPQIEIRVKDRIVNLLDVGHRAADALIRSTELGVNLEEAFIQCAAGNAVPLAKIAPTTLVFGAWDSRGSQAKVPRLIDSIIKAFGVTKLSRSAQYFSALEKDEVEELLETDTQKQRKLVSKAGFLDAPSGLTHGGIIVSGDIVRTTVVNLTALRALGAPGDEECLALRRYILALTVVAAFAPGDFFLRQGCLLVRASKPPENKVVFRDGRRPNFEQVLSDIELFAEAAAKSFVVGEDRSVPFDARIAKELVKKASKIKEES